MRWLYPMSRKKRKITKTDNGTYHGLKFGEVTTLGLRGGSGGNAGQAHATGANPVEEFWDECCNVKR